MLENECSSACRVLEASASSCSLYSPGLLYPGILSDTMHGTCLYPVDVRSWRMSWAYWQSTGRACKAPDHSKATLAVMPLQPLEHRATRACPRQNSVRRGHSGDPAWSGIPRHIHVRHSAKPAQPCTGAISCQRPAAGFRAISGEP